MESLAGQIAIVTGATGAVGSSISRLLIARGVTVCAVGRTAKGLRELAEENSWSNDQLERYEADLAVECEIRRVCEECCARHKAVHILIHSAGILKLEKFELGALTDLDAQYKVNVRAPFQITQACLASLKIGHGQVVFINSTAAERVKRGTVQYGATKRALGVLADGLRNEVNVEGIRVVSVHLGRTASRMQRDIYDGERRPYRPEYLLQPSDVASVVLHALELPRTAEVTDVWIRPMLKSY